MGHEGRAKQPKEPSPTFADCSPPASSRPPFPSFRERPDAHSHLPTLNNPSSYAVNPPPPSKISASSSSSSLTKPRNGPVGPRTLAHFLLFSLSLSDGVLVAISLSSNDNAAQPIFCELGGASPLVSLAGWGKGKEIAVNPPLLPPAACCSPPYLGG